MIGYKYIENLFQAILDQSNTIKGRFYVSHQYGMQEINFDELGQLVSTIKNLKYPLSIMPPPHSRGKFRESDQWERFRIIIFFAKTSEYGLGSAPNPNTKTATHTILEDWHDMRRCALDFKSKLEVVQKATLGKIFRIPDNIALMLPFSEVGVDKISGVRFDFDFDLFIGCESSDDYDNFTVPNIPLDDHPIHEI